MPLKKISTTASPSKGSSAKERSANGTTGANAPLAATKRKLQVEPETAIVISSDSDSGMIENPTPAKKKRVMVVQRDTPPSPGSQAYRDLPAVSVSSLVLAAMKSAVPSAGAISPAFDPQEHKVTSAKTDKQDGTRPERIKVKTEKAMYAEKLGVDGSGDLKEGSLVKCKGKNRDTPQLLASPLIAKKATTATNQIARDDASPEVSDIEWPSTPVKSIKFEEREDHVAWSDQEPDVSESKDGEKAVEDASVSRDEVHEEEDPLMQVMLKSIQDPELAPIYQNLPELGIYRTVRQYSYVTTVGMGVVMLKDIQNRLGDDDICRLVRALLFTKSGMFVNPARVTPEVFVADFGRLKLREPSSVAVCIMTGIVTECTIVSEGWSGGPDNEKAVHKISIAPFRQEFRRDTTMWGKILNFDNISCAVSTDGISFTTKPRTLPAPIFSAPGPSSPKTPKKGGSRALTVVLSPAPVRRADNFITSRSFEQQVPIYDGRSVKGAREFTFTDDAFSKLATWPLYEKGVQDLPFDAVVSVGYTLNTFGEGPRGGPNGLSTNLHFVILLALPDSDDD